MLFNVVVELVDMDANSDDEKNEGWQKSLLSSILIIGFLVLLARLVDVSLIRGGYYERLAKNNRIRAIPIHAPRGVLLDRNGVVLATNEESTRVLRFEAGKPARFTYETEVKDPENEIEVTDWRRTYPYGTTTVHIVGYVGETSDKEVGSSGCLGSVYGLGDTIGRMGAEFAFDCELRGRNGEELVEVDSLGNKVRVLGRREPQKGKDVQLSLDAGLEQRATNALEGKKGAVVALDPKSGKILALVSSPTFDPNLLSTFYSQLSTNPDLPLFNRALGGAYPPGSTFKIVTAAAGLEEGKVDENTRYVDPGVITIDRFSYPNWFFTQYGKTEGEIDLVRAIARSTDTFFYKVGEWVGVEKLAEWAEKFGLGTKTGIEIGGETSGIIPNTEWKERVKGERWFLGNTYHMAIGQADVTASPLQIAIMTGIIASDGMLCTPHLKEGENPHCKEIGLSDKTIDLITQGMIGACSLGGTAFPLFDFKVKSEHLPADATHQALQAGEPEGTPGRQIQVACKTGTAQFGDPQDRTHAWLTAFAPAENPEIVVTVLVEAGGEGSYVAAPIAKQVLEAWFSR